MKKLLIVFLSFLCLSSFGQTTSMSFSTIPTTDPDLQRPGCGANQWIGANVIVLPGTSTQSTRMDAYNRMTALAITQYNSAQGVYDFTYFDQQIQSAIIRRQRFSFAIMQNFGTDGGNGIPGSGPGGSSLRYPLYLHNQMQSEAVKDFATGGLWIPNYNSPSWLAYWKNLNIAVNNHIMTGSFNGINYRDVIGTIDVSGYGDYGEWTNNHFNGPSGSIATVATLDSIINYTVFGYPTFRCVIEIGTFDGGQLSNTNTPIAVGWYAYQVQNYAGRCGITRLNWGWDDTNPNLVYTKNWTIANNRTFVVPAGFSGAGSTFHFDTACQNRWKEAPWSGEPADLGNTSAMCGSAFCDLPQEMTEYHCNNFGNGNFDATVGQAALSTNVRAASKRAGYRVFLTGGSTPTSLTTGGAFQIVTKWQNAGVTPPYRSWNVIFRLKNGSTILKTFTSSFNPKLFLPTAVDNTITDNFNLSGVPAGTGYALTISVEDPTGYTVPMPLFITTAQNSDGSYNVRTSITVSNASGTPVANAGTDQSITLPTASVTLDGSGSTGTITTYLWTLISGPNTPTITTPSTVGTTVTGLIAGTYVFQISVNGGVSTDQLSVIVNPVLPASASIFTTQTPLAVTDNDNTPGVGTEKGVRFKSTVAGYITGIRFYKTTGNDGLHIGELYTNTGTLLASAIFVNETGTGWQTVSLPTPIFIIANTTYVAAYFSSLGNYVEDNFYFQTTGVTNTNLIAVIDATGGASGIDPGTGQGPYIDTSTPAFPNLLFKSANYWVDVRFQITTPGKTFHRKAHVNKFIPEIP